MNEPCECEGEAGTASAMQLSVSLIASRMMPNQTRSGLRTVRRVALGVTESTDSLADWDSILCGKKARTRLTPVSPLMCWKTRLLGVWGRVKVSLLSCPIGERRLH